MIKLLLIFKEIYIYIKLFHVIKYCLKQGVYKFDGRCFSRGKNTYKSPIFKILFFPKFCKSKIPIEYQLDRITIVRTSFSSNKVVGYNGYYYNFVKKIKYELIDMLPYQIPIIVFKDKRLFVQEPILFEPFSETHILQYRCAALHSVPFLPRPKYIDSIEDILKLRRGYIETSIQHGDYNGPNFMPKAIIAGSNLSFVPYVVDYDFTGVYPVLYDYLSLLFLNDEYKKNICLFLRGFYDNEIKSVISKIDLKDKYLIISIFILTRFFTTKKYRMKSLNRYVYNYLCCFFDYLDCSNTYIEATKKYIIKQGG